VVFAGPVAGSLHVTVLHADGVRTSYSFLQAVGTTVGATVAGGDPIGTAGSRLHFGARVGDAYFDPSALFAAAVTVELLPFEVPPGSTPDAEARALLGLALDRGGLPLGDVGASWRWLRGGAVEGAMVVAGGAGLAGARTAGRGLALASDLVDRLAFPGPCSSGPPPDRPVAGQRRVAITVAGLGSTSGYAAVDDLRTSDLGYDDGRVVRFSYAGGHTPESASALPGLPASEYTSADTQGDAFAAGARLADLVEQVAAADPQARVDVYAHSLGGLVARLALAELVDRGFDLTRLGLVATIASPHGGADLATAVATATAPWAGPGLDAAAGAIGLGLDPDAPVVEQLSEGSALVDQLASAGVPQGVRFLSIAARGDVVVASPHTDVGGADQVTIPVAGLAAHTSVVGSDAATAELARGLAGRPPGCEAWHDVVADVLAGHAVSAVEDDLGLALAAAG
jgi:triacylglycerol esterase/lipase EstA (alpha/beta hydrolase family)